MKTYIDFNTARLAYKLGYKPKNKYGLYYNKVSKFIINYTKNSLNINTEDYYYISTLIDLKKWLLISYGIQIDISKEIPKNLYSISVYLNNKKIFGFTKIDDDNYYSKMSEVLHLSCLLLDEPTQRA